MSTILKALRRLEQEKGRTASRPLREDVVVQPARRQRTAWWAVAGAAALAGVAVFTLLRELGDGAVRLDPVPPPPVAAALPEPPAAERAPAPPAPRPEPVSPVAPLAPAVPPLAVAAPEATTAGLHDSDVELVRPMESRPSRLVEEPAAAEPVEPVRREAPSPRAAQAPRHGPPLRVVRTSWHPLPERRTAWVEWDAATREVREGGRVGPYRVREIEPDGVLFADGAALLRKAIGAR